MAGKTKSAAEQVHSRGIGSQLWLSARGRGALDVPEAVNLLMDLRIEAEFDLKAWVRKNGEEFFRKVLEDEKRGKAEFLRSLVQAVELPRQPASPWRWWVVAIFRDAFTEDEDGKPIEDPFTFSEIHECIEQEFGIEIAESDLRKELKALGIPIRRVKSGPKSSPPVKQPVPPRMEALADLIASMRKNGVLPPKL